ncbi:MAG: hypothetical protein ACJ8AD_01625 [Gemmatimonadaceae bacterium]
MHLSFAAAAGLFWASVACCALAQFFILRSVGGGGRRHVPAHIAHLPRQRGAMEVLWAVVPAIALAVLLAFTWRAIRAAPTGVQGTAPAVEVVR